MILNDKKLNSNFKFIKTDYLKNIDLKGKLSHKAQVTLDNTLKILNYNYQSNGKLDYLKTDLNLSLNNSITDLKNKKLKTKDSKISIEIDSKKNNSIKLEGFYLIDGEKYKKYYLNNNIKNKINNLDLLIEFDQKISLPVINYFKKNGIMSNIKSNLKISKDIIEIVNLEYSENENQILLKNIIFDKNKKFKDFRYAKIKTFLDQSVNNDFEIYFKDNIEIKGKKFDGTNLSKIKRGEENYFKITKDIIINFGSINTPLSKKIEKFNLIGKIVKGEFTKISSKGEFGNEKYLDVSLKKDLNSNKRFLEIYSDVPEVMLSGYNFFKGLEGGRLLFTSVIDGDKSFAKLNVENFKIKNAPAIAKLLSLADLGGMLDLLSGKGLRFDKLEIKFVKDKNGINLEELYALGPSISVLMDGYTENKTGLVSLRGTMIPAKTLNKFLSKIPVVGDILIPKEIGEGLFGVSFKIKGYPGKLKTTVNPIKTLTPRFIQKALEKKTK